MGDSAGSRSAFHLGMAAGHGATLRCVVQDRRSSHGDPTRGSSSAPIPTKKAHIYSAEEIKKILLQAAQLDSQRDSAPHLHHSFRPSRCQCMRVNEAVKPGPRDVDLLHGILTIVGRSLASRAMCPSIIDRSRARTVCRRKRLLLPMPTAAFFVSEREPGLRLHGALHLRQAVAATRPALPGERPWPWSAAP